MGSADFVSPELLAEEPTAATASSDLWALGCIIYQMIAGNPPFKNTEDPEFGPAREYATMQRIGSYDGSLAFHEESFPADAADGQGAPARELVSALLKPAPAERLGADSTGVAGGGDAGTDAEELLTALKYVPPFSHMPRDLGRPNRVL